MKSVLAVIFLLFAFVSLSIGYWYYSSTSFMNNTFVSGKYYVEKSEPFSKSYRTITEGLNPPLFFNYYLTYVKPFKSMRKYGYYFADNVSLSKLIDDISNGKTSFIKLTIPEGYNIYDIQAKLKEANISQWQDFLSLAKDKAFIFEVTGENIPSLEGFLYPDTYFLDPKTNVKVLVKEMVKRFNSIVKDDMRNTNYYNGYSFYDILVLASVIQKETYVPEEYGLVASVFYNRIHKNMRLQSDPTIIYGLLPDFDGNIKRSDIENSNNRYNTYRINGLPPTPICNPSINAIMAAAKPVISGFYYFVAAKDGKHIFSSDYGTHRRNVNKLN